MNEWIYLFIYLFFDQQYNIFNKKYSIYRLITAHNVLF